ncbi:hypothetical protein C8J57DRAFT_985129, partial [Mycena rebaudengoi]
MTVVGDFDPCTSVNLILWNHRLTLPFESGSTFLFSGRDTPYSFTSLDRGESHFLVSQYFSGGVDRFVENGYQS